MLFRSHIYGIIQITLNTYQIVVIIKGGISYGENIRFRTLLSIIELSEQIQKELPKINYNVLIIHDKKDIVISKTSIEMIKNKKYINIKDGRHDILANKPYIVTSYIINWINEDNV